MRSFNYSILTLLLISFLPSCRKYVEDVPIQGQRVLVYTSDYRLLLNNHDQQEVSYGLAPLLSCDDLEITSPDIQNNLKNSTIQQAMYSWKKPFYIDQQTDNDWNSLYSQIYVYNVVINGVNDSKGGDIILKNTLLGEALLHRAFAYFNLVNLYGKQYDEATAATDPGVPIMLKPVLFTDLTRPGVKAVYEQIYSDIRQCIPLLPPVQETAFKPSKAAAYALLSKYYLNMRNFTKAAEFADSTLDIRNDLYDYNLSVTGSSYTFPGQYADKQVILRKVPRQMYGAYQLSNSLLGLLNTKDLRYEIFTRPGSNFFPVFTGPGYWSRDRYSNDKPATGLSVNDTWLIKAECLARAGQKDAAVDMLNTMRKKRFRPADYTDLSAATPTEALQMVIDERRREFFGSGLRWFDQRRLNQDAMFAHTITRVFNNTTYTLAPNSNEYVFPLANLLLTQNPEMKQNP